MGRVVEQPAISETRFDQNKRDYDDLTTQFAEMLNGSMRTPFEYQFDGHELYARDGSSMRLEFEKGLEQADRIADRNPNLAFEVRRRRAEIDEYHDMRKMAEGRLPNTMVVVSDFPAELMDSSADIGGYNVERKQTFLRVLAWDGNRMRMYSQTLDGSNRVGLEAIYQSLGRTPRPGELLSQRLHVELDATEQDFLVDKLVAVYDQQLSQQYGGSWRAGRQDNNRLNTYDFVRQQHDLIQYALQQKRRGELHLYGVAASLEARFQRNLQLQPEAVISRYDNPFHNLGQEIIQASLQARTMGRIFSACGVSLGGEAGLAEQLETAGYGNKSDAETRYKFDKKMYCVDCQAPPEKDAKPKWCGPCGLCRSCDKKHGGKG